VSGDCCCGRIKSSNDFAAEILGEHGRGCRSQRRAARRLSAAGRQAGARAPAARVAFLIGLSELGFAVGQDVSIEYRWLPSPLAPAAEALMDFTRTNVDVIVAVGTPATLSTGDQRGRAAGDNEGQRQRAFDEVPAARRVAEGWAANSRSLVHTYATPPYADGGARHRGHPTRIGVWLAPRL